jgi:hypothetical protein
MPSPLSFRYKPLAAIAAVLVLAGCQPGPNTHPVPSVQQIGGDLKCATGDHSFEDVQAGWGFCYPGVWRYNERSQSYHSPDPALLDLTFDITDVSVPCPSGVASSTRPGCSPTGGFYGFMIISTYERGGAGTLATWVQANLPAGAGNQPIRWGNSLEAGHFADGRRIALTPHHVVIMELHSGGLLDLETAMSARLDTWRFTY